MGGWRAVAWVGGRAADPADGPGPGRGLADCLHPGPCGPGRAPGPVAAPAGPGGPPRADRRRRAFPAARHAGRPGGGAGRGRAAVLRVLRLYPAPGRRRPGAGGPGARRGPAAADRSLRPGPLIPAASPRLHLCRTHGRRAGSSPGWVVACRTPAGTGPVGREGSWPFRLGRRTTTFLPGPPWPKRSSPSLMAPSASPFPESCGRPFQDFRPTAAEKTKVGGESRKISRAPTIFMSPGRVGSRCAPSLPAGRLPLSRPDLTRVRGGPPNSSLTCEYARQD